MYHFYITSYKHKFIYNKWHNIPSIKLSKAYTNPTCNRAMEMFWFKNLGMLKNFSYVND